LPNTLAFCEKFHVKTHLKPLSRRILDQTPFFLQILCQKSDTFRQNITPLKAGSNFYNFYNFYTEEFLYE